MCKNRASIVTNYKKPNEEVAESQINFDEEKFQVMVEPCDNKLQSRSMEGIIIFRRNVAENRWSCPNRT